MLGTLERGLKSGEVTFDALKVMPETCYRVGCFARATWDVNHLPVCERHMRDCVANLRKQGTGAISRLHNRAGFFKRGHRLVPIAPPVIGG